MGARRETVAWTLGPNDLKIVWRETASLYDSGATLQLLLKHVRRGGNPSLPPAAPPAPPPPPAFSSCRRHRLPSHPAPLHLPCRAL